LEKLLFHFFALAFFCGRQKMKVCFVSWQRTLKNEVASFSTGQTKLRKLNFTATTAWLTVLLPALIFGGVNFIICLTGGQGRSSTFPMSKLMNGIQV
jgi:hypothetical protein